LFLWKNPDSIMQMKEKENNKVNAQEDIEEEFENVGTYINPSMNVDF